MKKIFVNIASYLDHQILPTLHDILIQAKYPDSLHICIIHQHDKKNVFLFEEFYNDPRVTIINIDYKNAKGACYARYLGNKKYNNEDYVLMCDSHTRFSKNWDEELINMHNECLKYSEKPCISSYCAFFEVNSELCISGNRFMMPCFKDKSGVLKFNSIPKKDNELRQHAFWGACFSFSSGDFFKEVPYDPDLYFFGEEITIALRAWTRGWDFYLPNKIILEHEISHINEHQKRTKHENSSFNWEYLNERSLNKARKICSGKITGIYGLGNERTLKEYEAAAGISFKDQYIWHGENKYYRPFPAFQNYEDFRKTIKPNNRFVDVTFDWSEHKDMIEKHNTKVGIDLIELKFSWHDRTKTIPVDFGKGIEYSCKIKNYPIDVFTFLDIFDEDKKLITDVVAVYFYKKDDAGKFVKNKKFQILDGINITFEFEGIERKHRSVTTCGRRDIYSWSNKDNSFSEKLKRQFELQKLNDKILFLHIPKCAGNSIIATIIAYWKSNKICYTYNHFNHVSKKELLEFWNIKRTENFKSMAVIRNPFDRFYSAYNFGFCQNKIKHIAEGRSHFFSKPYSFEHFCKLVYNYYINNNCTLPKNLTILKTQYSFIEDLEGNIKDMYLLDYANLEKEWEHICLKFNLGNKNKLLHLNSSRRKTNDFMSVYTEETAKIVEKIYEKDINIYQEVLDKKFSINSSGV